MYSEEGIYKCLWLILGEHGKLGVNRLTKNN